MIAVLALMVLMAAQGIILGLGVLWGYNMGWRAGEAPRPPAPARPAVNSQLQQELLAALTSIGFKRLDVNAVAAAVAAEAPNATIEDALRRALQKIGGKA